jgi:hypothetical protein
VKKLLAMSLGLISMNSFAIDQFSVNTAAGANEQQVSADVSRLWNISGTKLFLGTGIRGTSQWSSGQTFKTAPANLTTGSEGPQVLLAPDKKKNIDELTLKNTQVTSLNLAFYILYQYSEKWGFGTNIDVVGGSFGKTAHGHYNPRSDDGSYPSNVTARPAGFNLLLISDNDFGSLNSEFFIKRRLDEVWSLKFGANFAFSEYKTSKTLRNGNDRFRHKSLLPTLGLSRVF